ATYGLAALLHARHPLQIVITGPANDATAAALEKSATKIYRFGKVILRLTPEQLRAGSLPPALQQTLPHLDASIPQAFVCVETTCYPPISDPEKLAALVSEAATG